MTAPVEADVADEAVAYLIERMDRTRVDYARLVGYLRRFAPPVVEAALEALVGRRYGITEPAPAVEFDECPVGWCQHRHDPAEPCLVVVDEAGVGPRGYTVTETPCGCHPCERCKGHGVIPGPNNHGERQCPRCHGGTQA